MDQELRVAKLTDRDDIEAYLTTFERLMSAYRVPKDRWIFKLAPQLSGPVADTGGGGGGKPGLCPP